MKWRLERGSARRRRRRREVRRYYDSGESTSLLEIIYSPAAAAEFKQQINSLSLQLSEAGQAAREREAELVHALEVATSNQPSISEV